MSNKMSDAVFSVYLSKTNKMQNKYVADNISDEEYFEWINKFNKDYGYFRMLMNVLERLNIV